MKDEFRTIEAEATAETKIQGSRFIAKVSPVESKEEVESILAALRKEFFNATHHCYAYRLGINGDQFRLSDNGEPSGTAGKPMFAAITKRELTNILVVVTRYFGGTKLGVGRLARAYGEAADLALGRAMIVTKFETEVLRSTFPHSQIGNVMHIVTLTDAQIRDTAYDEEVHLELLVRRSRLLDFKQKLVEATSGNVRFG